MGPQAAFRCFANQTWTVGATGSYCDVATTPNGSTTMASVLVFNHDGGITSPGVTGGDKGANTLNMAGLYVNGAAVATGSTGSSALIPPRTPYTADTAGNLFPLLYTGAGANAAPSEWTQGVVASLGSDVTLQLRFPMPHVLPSGVFTFRSVCLANATSGVVKYTVQDADVSGSANPSSATLTSETQNSITWAAADTYVTTDTTLSSTPVADHFSVVALTLNHTGYTLAANLGCNFYELWK